jgi:hypothetical protein
LLTPPSTKEQPYWMKYWIRIPQVMAYTELMYIL